MPSYPLIPLVLMAKGQKCMSDVKKGHASRSGLYGGTFQKFTDDKFDRSQYTYLAT